MNSETQELVGSLSDARKPPSPQSWGSRRGYAVTRFATGILLPQDWGLGGFRASDSEPTNSYPISNHE